MGMDVYGRAPTAEVGTYFRRTVWSWRPLAAYCQFVAPEFRYEGWNYNDGWGLGRSDTNKLADKLQAELDNGAAAKHILERNSRLEALPNEPCDLCGATGTRLPAPLSGPGDPTKGHPQCNKCEGAGFVRPSATWYPLDLDDIREFVAFLRDSGGFNIN